MSKMPLLTRPSYTDIDRACALFVARWMSEQPSVPVNIVGLARGGLIPAVIISHMFEALGYPNKLTSVAYSSKAGNGDGKNHDNVLPNIPRAHILIVDDIVDGGQTMKEVHAHFATQDHKVSTYALYYKESSIYAPDYYTWKIPADSPWIIFSWES